MEVEAEEVSEEEEGLSRWAGGGFLGVRYGESMRVAVVASEEEWAVGVVLFVLGLEVDGDGEEEGFRLSVSVGGREVVAVG